MRKKKTLGLDKKKVTAVGRSLTVLGSTFGVDSISEEVAEFSPLWFPREKIFVSLVSFDVLVLDCYTCYSLSKDPNIMLA